MFNGFAPLLLILTPGAHPILAGPVGLLGAVVLALLGAVAWAMVGRRNMSENLVDGSRTVDGPPAPALGVPTRRAT